MGKSSSVNMGMGKSNSAKYIKKPYDLNNSLGGESNQNQKY